MRQRIMIGKIRLRRSGCVPSAGLGNLLRDMKATRPDQGILRCDHPQVTTRDFRNRHSDLCDRMAAKFREVGVSASFLQLRFGHRFGLSESFPRRGNHTVSHPSQYHTSNGIFLIIIPPLAQCTTTLREPYGAMYQLPWLQGKLRGSRVVAGW